MSCTDGLLVKCVAIGVCCYKGIGNVPTQQMRCRKTSFVWFAVCQSSDLQVALCIGRPLDNFWRMLCGVVLVYVVFVEDIMSVVEWM